MIEAYKMKSAAAMNSAPLFFVSNFETFPRHHRAEKALAALVHLADENRHVLRSDYRSLANVLNDPIRLPGAQSLPDVDASEVDNHPIGDLDVRNAMQRSLAVITTADRQRVNSEWHFSKLEPAIQFDRPRERFLSSG